MTPQPKRILVTQLRRIGDVLMTTPAVRALRKAYPEAHITFLTERPSDQVLACNPNIDEIIVTKQKKPLKEQLKLILSLRKKKFDLVIDFFGNPSSALLCFLTGAPRRIGFDFRGRGKLFTDRVAVPAEGYAAVHKTHLLTPLGIEPDGYKIDLYIDDDDRAYADRQLAELGVTPEDTLVTLSPVSRQPYKVWPAERFAAVADALIERHNAKILFIYGPGEEHFVADVRKHMSNTALPNYPVPTLRQTRALFGRAALHVGNDNGPCHFAIAAGTPTVTIFGRPRAANWSPPDADYVISVETDPGCKTACVWPECGLECLTGTTAETVLTAAESLMNRGGNTL